MTKSKDVYVATVNVPKEMTFTQRALTPIFSFVEIRAELTHWDGQEPKYFLTINDLSVIDAQNIIWEEFATVLDELVSNHFKELKWNK